MRLVRFRIEPSVASTTTSYTFPIPTSGSRTRHAARMSARVRGKYTISVVSARSARKSGETHDRESDAPVGAVIGAGSLVTCVPIAAAAARIACTGESSILDGAKPIPASIP
jgi:hypothetical protein